MPYYRRWPSQQAVAAAAAAALHTQHVTAYVIPLVSSPSSSAPIARPPEPCCG